MIWLNNLLLKENLPEVDLFFSNVNVTDSPNMTVLPLLFDNATACIITLESLNLLNDLNPQVKNKLKIIKESPGYLLSLSCATPNIYKDKDYLEMISESSENLKKTSEGRQILSIFKFDRILEFKEEFLEGTKRLLNEQDSLKLFMSLRN